MRFWHLKTDVILVYFVLRLLHRYLKALVL
jgi:hypothetical protein